LDEVVIIRRGGRCKELQDHGEKVQEIRRRWGAMRR